jgi:hypothetical protein
LSTREKAYGLFLDEDGQPQLIDCAVLFWDVMGVRAMSTQPPQQALADLRNLRAAVLRARDRANTEEEEEFLRCSSWFTDNVVLAAPVWGPMDEELVIGPTQVDAAYMQLLMLDSGYLSRGAISFGPHFMDRSFVYGPALIEANDLEGGKNVDDPDGGDGNRWPCVVVSDGIAARSFPSAVASGRSGAGWPTTKISSSPASGWMSRRSSSVWSRAFHSPALRRPSRWR